MLRDLHNNIKVSRAISPTRVTDNTAQVSQIIDTADFGSLEFVIAAGTLADADATFAVLVEHGAAANLSDAATVDSSFLIGSASGAGFQFDSDDQVRKIGYVGDKRYVRLTITPAANSGNADISCVAVQGHPRKAPRSSQSA